MKKRAVMAWIASLAIGSQGFAQHHHPAAPSVSSAPCATECETITAPSSKVIVNVPPPQVEFQQSSPLVVQAPAARCSLFHRPLHHHHVQPQIASAPVFVQPMMASVPVPMQTMQFASVPVQTMQVASVPIQTMQVASVPVQTMQVASVASVQQAPTIAFAPSSVPAAASIPITLSISTNPGPSSAPSPSSVGCQNPGPSSCNSPSSAPSSAAGLADMMALKLRAEAVHLQASTVLASALRENHEMSTAALSVLTMPSKMPARASSAGPFAPSSKLPVPSGTPSAADDRIDQLAARINQMEERIDRMIEILEKKK